MKKTKSNMNTRGEQSYIIGFVTAVMVASFFLMISAWIVTVKDLSDTAITILSYLVLCVSSFFGSWTASRVSKCQGLKIGGIIGTGIFLAVFLVGVFINGFSINTGFFIKLLLCTITGMVGGIVGVNGAGKRKMKS